MNDIDFRFKGTKVFKWITASPKKIIICRGGTRSSKTYSLAQITVLFLFTGWVSKNDKGGDVGFPDGVFSVVRKSFPALKATVLRDFLEVLHRANLYRFVKHNMVDSTFKYKGRMVEFFSVDDQQKVRGRKRRVLWCNEANELGYMDEFYQMLLRTTDKVYLDFNPDDDQIWINTQLEQKRAQDKGDVEVIVSNYMHNPFLTPDEIAEIEYLKETDDIFWTVFGLGEYGHIRGLIYKDWKQTQRMPEGESFFGLDFGFANDPAALVELQIKGNILYGQELIYETGLTNWALGEMMRAENIKRQPIWADSSEPKSIKELELMGFNIKAVKKGQDSVRNGILKLQELDVRFTERSVNVWKERRRYKWKVNRQTGETEQKPVKRWDHIMDAIRYGVIGQTTQTKGKPTFTHIRK